jgi:PAS domain S-box-containing protein
VSQRPNSQAAIVVDRAIHDTEAAGAALRESEERLRRATLAARVVVWEWDLATDTFTWSGDLERFLGVEPGSLDQSSGWLRRAVHPDDLAMLETAVARCRADGEPFLVEHRVIWPDGTIRWLEARGTFIPDPHGVPVRAAGTGVDITDRKLAETQRESCARGEKLRALGQMAGGIAHDLNQALAVVSGYADLARETLLQGDVNEALDQLEIIAQAAIQGAETVKRLLTFTRHEEPGLIENVDFKQVLDEAARFTAPRWRDATQAEGRPILLTIAAEPGLRIRGLSYAVREALINLILNAVDALPYGGEIRLSTRSHGDRVTVEIVDTGIGMSAGVQARIFEPFYTTKGERGSGLGLAMVFAIVEQHEGTVTVESAEGKGTTFRLTFPLHDEAARPDDRHAPTNGPLPARVLIVEDDPTIGRMLTTMLERLECQVQLAASGEDALSALEAAPVDVVISDLGLGPGMNGWELAEQVRRRWPGPRFVLASGWSASIAAHEAATRGVDGLLAKPYRINDIREIVSRLKR